MEHDNPRDSAAEPARAHDFDHTLVCGWPDQYRVLAAGAAKVHRYPLSNAEGWSSSSSASAGVVMTAAIPATRA